MAAPFITTLKYIGDPYGFQREFQPVPKKIAIQQRLLRRCGVRLKGETAAFYGKSSKKRIWMCKYCAGYGYVEYRAKCVSSLINAENYDKPYYFSGPCCNCHQKEYDEFLSVYTLRRVTFVPSAMAHPAATLTQLEQRYSFSFNQEYSSSQVLDTEATSP